MCKFLYASCGLPTPFQKTLQHFSKKQYVQNGISERTPGGILIETPSEGTRDKIPQRTSNVIPRIASDVILRKKCDLISGGVPGGISKETFNVIYRETSE